MNTKFTLGLTMVLAIVMAPTSNTQTLVLAGPDQTLTPASSSWSWDAGTAISEFRAALEDSANFGSGGVVETSWDTRDLATVDAASLAEVDVFIATWWADTNSTDAQVDAIEQFFLNGGSMVLFQDDSTHDEIGDRLGLPTIASDGSLSNGGTPFFEGVFGNAQDVAQWGATGALEESAVIAANGTPAAHNGTGQMTAAFWNPGDYAPGAGALCIIADVDMASLNTASYAPLNDNGTFILNAFAFLAEGSCSGSIEYYGTSTPGSGGISPSLSLNTCPTIGGSVDVRASGLLGGAMGVLILGVDRDALTIRNCDFLVAAPFVPVFHVASGNAGSPGAGEFVLPLNMPAQDVWSGQKVNLQEFVFDDGAVGQLACSNGLEFVID